MGHEFDSPFEKGIDVYWK